MRKIDSSQCEERKETASNEIVTVKKSPLKQEHMEDNVCHTQISARFLRLVGHFSIDFRRKRNTAVKPPLHLGWGTLQESRWFWASSHASLSGDLLKLPQARRVDKPQWVIFLLLLVSFTSMPLPKGSGLLLIKLQFGNKMSKVSKLVLFNV